jgi:hypothetical protein
MRSLTLPDQPIEARIRAAIEHDGFDAGEYHHLLTEGYAHALRVDSRRLRLEREIAAAGTSVDLLASSERLRSLLVRQRELEVELSEFRALLRRLKLQAGL